MFDFAVNSCPMLLLLAQKISPTELALVLAGSLALALLLLLLTRRHERKRTQALAAAAMQTGFSFAPASETPPVDDAGHLHLFSTGHGRMFRNVMRGSAGGAETVVFEYQYTTGSGKNQSTHKQTVAAFRLTGAALPGFSLGPESFAHKIAALFGYRDINFDAHPEFSRRYVLRGNDEDAVRSLFSSALIDFFETLANEKKWWTVEGGGEWLLVYRHGSRIKPAELPQFVQEAAALASAFRASTGAAKFGW